MMNDSDAPKDVVPRRDPDPAVIERLRKAHGETVTVTVPGEVILDVDGIPAGVTESTTHAAHLTSKHIDSLEG